jgi:carboxymethylproline synthase
MSRMVELTELLTALDADPAVGCVVLFGGEGRSFAAGGDFNETSEFLGGPEVDAWIDRITDLYSTIASISCPVLAAIDGYAIGLGLQMSLCCDYRIGSTRAALIMPEFRLGIACNLGGFLLEQVVGRSVMQNMLFTCEAWPAERALADGLLHRVTEPEAVLDEAVCRARTISGYTRAAVRSTRPRINESVVRGLEVVRQQGKASHRSAFAAGEAQKRMRDILGRGEA